MGYLYVFMDESGNYDFTAKGTHYWVLTSVITDDIRPGLAELYELKHQIIGAGIDLEYFHATEDRQSVRNSVFAVMKTLTNIRIDALVVDKRKVAPAQRPLREFYPRMMHYLLQHPLDPSGVNVNGYDKVVFFLDRASSFRNEREALIAGVKTYLAHRLRGVPYHIAMHQSASHQYLQVVDYASWATYVKWERGEQRPWQQIQHLVKSEFPLFENELVTYYDWPLPTSTS